MKSARTWNLLIMMYEYFDINDSILPSLYERVYCSSNCLCRQWQWIPRQHKEIPNFRTNLQNRKWKQNAEKVPAAFIDSDEKNSPSICNTRFISHLYVHPCQIHQSVEINVNKSENFSPKKNFLNETDMKNYNESPHRQFIYFDSITSNVHGD